MEQNDIPQGTGITEAFDKMKQLIAHDVIMAHPTCELPFQMYTDAIDYNLSAVSFKITDQ